MTLISEFFGEGDYKQREAHVRIIADNVMHVEMYDELGLFKIHKLVEKTVQQAENIAENWVIGVE